jgi:hypothetical protein
MMFKMKLTLTHFAVFAAIVGVALALMYYKVSSAERQTQNKLKEIESHVMSMYASMGASANVGDVCYAAVPPAQTTSFATHDSLRSEALKGDAGLGVDNDDNYSVSSEDVKDILSSLDEAKGHEEALGGESATAAAAEPATSSNEYETELKKKSVDELKTMLKAHNESTKGTKYELIKRLVQLGDAAGAV